MKWLVLLVLLGCGVLPLSAGTLVDLSVEISLPAANDMIRATLYSEASGPNPADLARRVNGEVAEALKLARAREGVKVQSGQQATYPVYSANQKVESWRMRSEIVLESKDHGAVSTLIAQLQSMHLAVGAISLMPAPETRRVVADQAIVEAVQAFRKRAALVAGELGKSWKIRQLNISQGSNQPMPFVRQARMSMVAEVASAPLEAGESQVSASISGQIELAD